MKDVETAVLAAIEAANVRHAEWDAQSLDVERDTITFAWVYEFPEHRSGLIRAVRKAIGYLGGASHQKWDHYGQYAAEFTIRLADELDAEDVTKLQAAIKAKYE